MNLNKRIAWGEFYLLRIKSKVTGRPLSKSKYNGKQLLSDEESNEWIADALDGDKPFMVGRFGSNELAALWKVKDNGRGVEGNIEKDLNKLHFNAGFFPRTKNGMIRFAQEMKKAIFQVDLIGVWYQHMEEYEIKLWGNNPDYCELGGLEPFFVEQPWTAHLAGKKVLVIHPFADTITSQYTKRDSLFSNPMILPDFELITQKAVQTIAGNKDSRFGTWFDALDYMEQEALKKDFDVAIIGCGAYGFPLAARLKKAGKKVIHLGGATQLLFGIKGGRWESRSDYAALMNENWVKPMEKPLNAEKVEGGCYW